MLFCTIPHHRARHFHPNNMMRRRNRPLLLVVLATALIITIVLVATSASAFSASSPITRSPVIGILSQPDPDNADVFYIAASYVKWLEAGGARSIPIPYDASNELFDELFTEMDGLLLPGGTAAFPPVLNYALDQIVSANRQGLRFFPVWGTCLGYEFLVQYGGGVLATNYDAYNLSLPLEEVVVVIDQEQSPDSPSLYADPTIYETVRDYPVTMNNHHQGIAPQDFHNSTTLPLLWHVTSINHDRHGQPFVSTIEPVNPQTFPFYGVQYHPEKNAFEYATYPNSDIPYEVIDHSARGVAFSVYTARFFVDLARRSQQSDQHGHYTGAFPYVQQYPATTGLKFELKYLIPPHSNSSNSPSYSPASASASQQSSSTSAKTTRPHHLRGTYPNRDRESMLPSLLMVAAS
jgi:gamma-glutamyl hydrolase